MKTIKTGVGKLFVSIALSCLLVVFSGCGAILIRDATDKKYDRREDGTGNDVTLPELKDDRFLLTAADRFGLMALFAETVYRRELENLDERDKYTCRYLTGGTKAEAEYGMPKGLIGSWSRWRAENVPGDEAPCLNKDGLQYETYVYSVDSGKPIEAVIAFRGTENHPSQRWLDWSTSFAAAFGFEPKQYAEAQPRILNLIKRLQEANSDVRIYATGHSLGGGLAQQAGYLSKSVLEVFTFNTSPVTNWTFLRKKNLVEQGFPIIHRVYHGGEFLEIPRFAATMATDPRYGRHDVGVQFWNRNSAKGHSMKVLACNFASLIRDSELVTAEHNYYSQFIKDEVVRDGKLGPAGRAVCSPKRDDHLYGTPD